MNNKLNGTWYMCSQDFRPIVTDIDTNEVLPLVDNGIGGFAVRAKIGHVYAVVMCGVTTYMHRTWHSWVMLSVENVNKES